MSLSPLFLIVAAFLIGVLLYFVFPQKKEKNNRFKVWRLRAYQITTGYLLFKIGFSGGAEIAQQPFSDIIFPATVCVFLAIFWTFFVLFILKKWSTFDEITKTSVAAHFGSVSVGTFIAALAFLEGIGIAFDKSVALWLAIMELPAILIAAWKMPISSKKIFQFLIKDWSVGILFLSIFLGGFLGNSIPSEIKTFLFSTLFLPLLLYFIFEIGQKSGESIQSARKHLSSFLFIGIGIPIIGGLFGSSLGYYLGYSIGNSFILSILVASASYVLAPLCIQEMLKMVPDISEKKIQKVIGISMSLSVGITLPFNILIGLELYKFFSKTLYHIPILAFVGISIPFALIIFSFWKKYFSSFRKMR